MSIIRVAKKQRNFTVLDNTPINDDRLPAEGLGLLAYLVSKPDDWEVDANHLATRFRCGRNRIYRILRDLRLAGYAEYSRTSDGSTEWIIAETPSLIPKTGTRAQQSPRTQNPDQGFGDVLVSTERAVNTERSKEAPVGALTAEQQKAEFWKIGVPLLTKQGMKEPQARTFLGKVVKKAGFPDALEAMRLARHSGDAASYLAAASFRVDLPEDNRSLWSIRAKLGLPYEYDDLKDCHAEIRKVLREKPELRSVVEA